VYSSDSVQQLNLSSETKKSAPLSLAKRQNSVSKQWGVIPASFMARNTDNPIRKIVDGMHLTPNPDKDMIALSIGIIVDCISRVMFVLEILLILSVFI